MNHSAAPDLPPAFLDVGRDQSARRIAVRAREGAAPGLFWLGGFNSDMKGTKALALDAWAAEQGRACVRFDYSGHGESSGQFAEGTIGRWLEDSVAVFERFCSGPQVVIGSSMGGWMALLLARELAKGTDKGIDKGTDKGADKGADKGVSVLTQTIVSVIPGPAQQEPGITQPSPPDSGFAPGGAPRNDGDTKRPEHNTKAASLAGLVLIAPAPDFTEELMWKGFSPDIRDQIERTGVWLRPSDYGDPYPITRALIEEWRNHLLLGGSIAVGCPVRILQGAQDPDVPWRHAFTLAQRLPAEDVVLTMIQDGDHRLSRPQDIARILAAVAEIG